MFTEINDIVQVLEEGGVILYPTDTIWGIGCDATNEAAVAKVYELKKRAANKSMIVLLPDAKSVFQYVANPHPDIVDVIKSFEKPTTIVYENGIGLAQNALAADGSIGIRVTTDLFCKTLLKRFKKPIISTSANISGNESPQHFDHISEELKEGVDYVVMYRRTDTKIVPPSSIIKIAADGVIEKIR